MGSGDYQVITDNSGNPIYGSPIGAISNPGYAVIDDKEGKTNKDRSQTQYDELFKHDSQKRTRDKVINFQRNNYSHLRNEKNFQENLIYDSVDGKAKNDNPVKGSKKNPPQLENSYDVLQNVAGTNRSSNKNNNSAKAEPAYEPLQKPHKYENQPIDDTVIEVNQSYDQTPKSPLIKNTSSEYDYISRDQILRSTVNNDQSKPSTSYDKVGSVISDNQIYDPVSQFSNKVNPSENEYSELYPEAKNFSPSDMFANEYDHLRENNNKKQVSNVQNYDHLTISSNSSEYAVPTVTKDEKENKAKKEKGKKK